MKFSIIVLDHIYIPFMSAESRLTPCDLMDYIACQAPLSMEFSKQEY